MWWLYLVENKANLCTFSDLIWSYHNMLPEQLNEIRKITVARVLCDTSDNMKIIQKYVMLQPISVAMENLG